MFPKIVFIALFVLAGPLLVFEAYGIHRLRESLPPSPETVLDTLCENLIRSAQAKGLTGAAKEIDIVSGPAHDNYFDSLPPFLNARLERGFKRFLFSDDVRRKTVGEMGRLLKRQDWASAPKEMAQTVPDVLLFAEWQKLSEEDVSLTLRAVRFGVSGEGVQAVTRFAHPRAILREEQRRKGLRLALYGAAAPLTALAVMSIGHLVFPRFAGGMRHGPTS